MPGTLTIRPLKANLRHDLDLFSRMDPYVEFLLGGQKVKTSVCYEGGRHPHWSNTFTLQSNNEPTLFVTLKDKDTFSHDDYIGNCQIDLRSITSFPKGPQWYPVMGKKGSEGEILIDISFNPGVQTYAQPYPQPSPVYGGYPVQQVQTAYTVPQQTMAYPAQPMHGYPVGQPTMAYQQPQPMMQQQPAYQPPMGYPVTTQPNMGVAYTQPQVMVQPNQGYPPMGGYGGHAVYRPY